MTDELEGAGPDPDFDDPAHTGIRDLLSSARVDAPIPAEVAARLDAALAELTGRPRATPEPELPAVLPLRRRRAPKLLAAAAVVAVAGVGALGLHQVVQNGSGSDDRPAATSAADSGGKSLTRTPPSAASEGADLLKNLDGDIASKSGRSVPVLTTSAFADQAGKLDLSDGQNLALTDSAPLNNYLTRMPPTPAKDPVTRGDAPSGAAPSVPKAASQRSAASRLDAVATRALGCPGPRIDGTASYAIVLDGQPAVLVVHPANAGTKLVEAWSCNGSEVLAFTTVPG